MSNEAILYSGYYARINEQMTNEEINLILVDAGLDLYSELESNDEQTK